MIISFFGQQPEEQDEPFELVLQLQLCLLQLLQQSCGAIGLQHSLHELEQLDDLRVSSHDEPSQLSPA